MSLVVYLGQVLEVKVRIDLGGRDTGVPEEFLDAAQIVARLKKVRREGVPEQVWRHVRIDTLAFRPVRDT